jgi:hypothetical protein
MASKSWCLLFPGLFPGTFCAQEAAPGPDLWIVRAVRVAGEHYARRVVPSVWGDGEGGVAAARPRGGARRQGGDGRGGAPPHAGRRRRRRRRRGGRARQAARGVRGSLGVSCGWLVWLSLYAISVGSLCLPCAWLAGFVMRLACSALSVGRSALSVGRSALSVGRSALSCGLPEKVTNLQNAKPNIPLSPTS